MAMQIKLIVVVVVVLFLPLWQIDNEHVIVFADDDIASRNETDIRVTFYILRIPACRNQTNS